MLKQLLDKLYQPCRNFIQKRRTALFSAGFFTSSAPSAHAESVGSISNNMLGVLSGLNSIGFTMAVTLGAGLLCAALFQYKEYRQNPNQTRLITPLALLIFGLLLLIIPLLVRHATGNEILSSQ